jgi:hypothetical protein
MKTPGFHPSHIKYALASNGVKTQPSRESEAAVGILELLFLRKKIRDKLDLVGKTLKGKKAGEVMGGYQNSVKI